MLVLTQRENEIIFLGDDVIINFLGMIGRRAKIAIKAPELLSILRQEICSDTQRKKSPVRSKR